MTFFLNRHFLFVHYYFLNGEFKTDVKDDNLSNKNLG